MGIIKISQSINRKPSISLFLKSDINQIHQSNWHLVRSVSRHIITLSCGQKLCKTLLKLIQWNIVNKEGCASGITMRSPAPKQRKTFKSLGYSPVLKLVYTIYQWYVGSANKKYCFLITPWGVFFLLYSGL